MHKPIEDGLEDYLTGRAASESHRNFVSHLEACAECAGEVREMKEQAEWMRELKAPAEAEPTAGFYARVMDRIEAQASNSFWSLFLEPVFGKRLALACLTLFVLLSSAVWQASPEPVLHQNNPMTILAGAEHPVVTGDDPGRDRTLVLTNLASYSNEQGPAPLLPVSSD